MDYQLKPADLILVRGASPLAHMIEGVSQVLIAMSRESSSRMKCLRLRHSGRMADFYRCASDIYTCVELTDDQRQRIVNRVLEKIGHHYGYRLVLWEGEHYLLHRDPAYNPAVDEPDCSQLRGEAYREEEFDPCPQRPVMSPGDMGASQLFRCVGPLT